jgi:hypothetical protein
MADGAVIFIFDLDGVLIECNGYIRAFIDTVKTITRRMGLEKYSPNASSHALFESSGVSSEWDMAAIWLAVLVEEIAREHGSEQIPICLAEFWNKEFHYHLENRLDFETVIKELRKIFIPGKSAAESVFQAAQEKLRFFEHSKNHPLLKELLLTTRDVRHNLVSSIFESFVVGSKPYTHITHQPTLVNSISYLEKYDKPLIAAKVREHLIEAAKGQLSLAICTSRPSLAPAGMNDQSLDFFPEAEIGIKMIHMEGVPFFGWGGVQALAVQFNEEPDNLLKPQPVQMLASIAAALGNDGKESLTWAEHLWKYEQQEREITVAGEGLKKPFPHEISLHIFEDLTTGLQAGKRAKRILENTGSKVVLHLWGISTHQEKIVALKSEGAKVFSKIDQAVEQAMKQELIIRGK